MRARGWWLLAVPIVTVAALSIGYVVGEAWASPYKHPPTRGVSIGFPVDAGVTRFIDIQIPPDGEHLAPHLTSVHAVGATPGLDIRFTTTTFDQIGQASSGFPLHCAQGANHQVASTPLSRSPDTVLRFIFTPTRPGTYHVTGFDLNWKAGIFQGQTFSPFDITVQASGKHTYDGCV